jgi:hypothetical protein
MLQRRTKTHQFQNFARVCAAVNLVCRFFEEDAIVFINAPQPLPEDSLFHLYNIPHLLQFGKFYAVKVLLLQKQTRVTRCK